MAGYRDGCPVDWRCGSRAQDRVSAQDSREYYRAFKSPLEELTRCKRGRKSAALVEVHATAWRAVSRDAV